MKPKHTPGPWAVLDDRAIVAGDILIAQTSKINDRDKANANLISAAPEMLIFLEQAADYVAEYCESHECGATRDFHNKITAALKKARGDF